MEKTIRLLNHCTCGKGAFTFMKISRIKQFLKVMYKDMKRKGLNKPAIEHPKDAAKYSFIKYIDNKSRRLKLIRACLLHDVLEDSGCDEDYLSEKLGLGNEDLRLLRTLSRNAVEGDGFKY